jgi:hypothetical protein
MVRTPNELSTIVVEKYRDLLERVLDSMRAEAKVSLDAGKPGIDFSVLVVPSSPRSASVRLDVAQKDFVFFHMGQGTTFEIPSSGGINLPIGQSEQILAFMTAAVEGRFEEDLTYVKDKLVAAKGIVHFVGSKWKDAHSMMNIGWLYLFKKKSRRHVNYEPYSRNG